MDGEIIRLEPNLSKTEVKRQHYIPQMYLRPFAVDGKIRVVDLDGGKREYKTSVGNVAVESHFYNVNVEDLRLSTEDWLAELECAAVPVFNKLIENPESILSLSLEEELIISRFITALRFRTPAFQDWNKRLTTSILTQIRNMAKDQIFHMKSRKEANAIWEEIKNKPDHWWMNEEKPVQPSETTAYMLSQVHGFANLIRAAPWRIGCAPDSIGLYTSDNPVASYLSPIRPWWEGGAFASHSYYMALSPTVLLVVERRPDTKEGEKLNPQGTRRHNDFSEWEISYARHLITRDARRYLYGEALIVDRDCAIECLSNIDQAKLEFAVRYLGYNPSPPSMPN